VRQTRILEVRPPAAVKVGTVIKLAVQPLTFALLVVLGSGCFPRDYGAPQPIPGIGILRGQSPCDLISIDGKPGPKRSHAYGSGLYLLYNVELEPGSHVLEFRLPKRDWGPQNLQTVNLNVEAGCVYKVMDLEEAEASRPQPVIIRVK
jgi:hypothetical protein